MARVPAVWHYAGTAARAEGDMPVSVLAAAGASSLDIRVKEESQ